MSTDADIIGTIKVDFMALQVSNKADICLDYGISLYTHTPFLKFTEHLLCAARRKQFVIFHNQRSLCLTSDSDHRTFCDARKRSAFSWYGSTHFLIASNRNIRNIHARSACVTFVPPRVGQCSVCTVRWDCVTKCISRGTNIRLKTFQPANRSPSNRIRHLFNLSKHHQTSRHLQHLSFIRMSNTVHSSTQALCHFPKLTNKRF